MNILNDSQWPCSCCGRRNPTPRPGGWVLGVYSMALCGPNRWDGGKVLCSPGSRAGNWLGGRIQVEKQWGEGGKKKRGRPLPLLSSSVSFRLSASQRCGLPAGSPRDLASLGLCEHRGGDRWGVWPVQLGPCGGRRGCWCQTAGRGRSSYTWEGTVRRSCNWLFAMIFKYCY